MRTKVQRSDGESPPQPPPTVAYNGVTNEPRSALLCLLQGCPELCLLVLFLVFLVLPFVLIPPPPPEEYDSSGTDGFGGSGGGVTETSLSLSPQPQHATRLHEAEPGVSGDGMNPVTLSSSSTPGSTLPHAAVDGEPDAATAPSVMQHHTPAPRVNKGKPAPRRQHHAYQRPVPDFLEFNVYDRNHDGLIDERELGDFCQWFNTDFDTGEGLTTTVRKEANVVD